MRRHKGEMLALWHPHLSTALGVYTEQCLPDGPGRGRCISGLPSSKTNGKSSCAEPSPGSPFLDPEVVVDKARCHGMGIP